MTNTTKTLLAILLIATAAFSGCIGTADVTRDNVTAELTSSTIETTELNASELIEIEYKIVSITVSQGNTDMIAGIGEVLVTINGGKDYDTLTEIEVFVNDVTLGTYPAEYQITNKVECDIIGTWNVRVDGTFTDGITQTLINTSGFELRELEDAPNAGALGERYIEPSTGMSREDAKKFCEENGIVWGCDDEPTIMPTIAPTIMPTIAPTPEPEPPNGYRISAIVDRMQWDETESTVALVLITDNQRREKNDANQLLCLNHIEVFVDGIVVASLDTTIVKGHTRMEVKECPMIINLPNKIRVNSEVIIIGSYTGTNWNPTIDGDYPISVAFRTPPMNLEEDYSEFPVWNP